MALKIAAGIILGIAVLMVISWYHDWFISECIASHNTPTYCEMQFWRSR